MANYSTKIEQLINKDTTKNQLSRSELVENAVLRKEGQLANNGSFTATTGKYTGRSPKDRFIVKDEHTKKDVDWGEVNQPIEPEVFDNLLGKVLDYLDKKEELFVFNGYAGADEDSTLKLRVINEYAWHNLFVKALFIDPKIKAEGKNITPDFTIVSAPNFKANPEVDGTKSETFIMVNFDKQIILIGGTEYGGEMKKSIFSVMNYLLPKEDILSMHCSANVGKNDDVALFFGLSGTGKTTLSADPDRQLIGDDEHGWNSQGIFNIEGGCYAKAIGLSEKKEPEIYSAIKFGTVLENVVLDDEKNPDYDDNTFTENTRAAYPINHIDNALIPSKAGHANTIIFLTADAFGVLPPISKLNKEQAMYHFLSGFTSKLAGTERGVTSPEPVFSTCFGAPFLPLHASVYADKLGNLIEEHNVSVYLVNTGWTGGEYGVGKRMNLQYTRHMVSEAVEGKLKNHEFVKDSTFGLAIPTNIDGVPNEVLNPKETWDDKEAYDQKASELITAFKENFKKFDHDLDSVAEKGGF